MTGLTTRRRLLQTGIATASAICAGRFVRAGESTPPSMDDVREKTLRFVESMRVTDGPYGRYRYAAGSKQPTLYSSTYAAMTRHLYRDLDLLTQTQRQEWIDYLQSHQDDDGLFRDPVIFGQGWYQDDPEWCGRRHLSCHVVTALTCLGAVAAKPMRFLDPFLEPGGLVRWLETRAWEDRPDFVGNEVLNLGTLMQYARDFQGEKRCGPAVRELLDWMAHHHINEQTGLWGKLDVNEPRGLSRAVMGGYHFWLLYFYDHVPIPYPERVVDSCLATQNAGGGFGQGVHTGSDGLSSACEDIDSIDPLARLMQVSDYRRDDIHRSLNRGLKQVLRNQTEDGGWWFVRGRGFTYGHEQLAAGATEGAMFPTWFRTLTLAYLGKALPDSIVGRYDWQFCNCPGIQFWETNSVPLARPPAAPCKPGTGRTAPASGSIM
ncbi:MAG: hypothetical protein GXY83_17885 [Rhodopirellula sp.]|nr:hypothetical protein [Rhodopirellula sp.]